MVVGGGAWGGWGGELPAASKKKKKHPPYLLPITHTNIELMHNLTSRPHPKRRHRLIYSNGASIIYGGLCERHRNRPPLS